MKKYSILLLAAVLLFISVPSFGEESTVYVTASQLYGRAKPKHNGIKEALFDHLDDLTATGRWSKDHRWIEVKGGESGTVWCSIEYLTERVRSFWVENENWPKVKIRKTPVSGKVIGYLKKGKTTEITQVIMGWGKCSKGWIDLEYLIEIDDPEM